VFKKQPCVKVLLLSSICGSTWHISLECCLCNIVAECSGVWVVVRVTKKFELRQEHVSKHGRHPNAAPLVATPRGLFLV